MPTIVSLQDHLETIRQAEIDRVRGRMGQLTPEQEIAVEALTRGIINKVMHTPITTLKTAAKESEATTVVDVVRRLFNLQEKDAAEKKTKWGRGIDCPPVFDERSESDPRRRVKAIADATGGIERGTHQLRRLMGRLL